MYDINTLEYALIFITFLALSLGYFISFWKDKEYSYALVFACFPLLLTMFFSPPSHIRNTFAFIIAIIYTISLMFLEGDLFDSSSFYLICLPISDALLYSYFNIYLLLTFQILVLVSFLIRVRRISWLKKKQYNNIYVLLSLLAIIIQLSIITLMFGAYYCKDNECTICFDVSQSSWVLKDRAHHFMVGLKSYFYNEGSSLFIIQKLTGGFISMVVLAHMAELARKFLFSRKDKTDM